MLHFFEHSFYTVVFSFAYRYYILTRTAPKKSILTLCILIVYLPSLIQAVSILYSLNSSNFKFR